jgi:PAS domain S-box-containing protein
VAHGALVPRSPVGGLFRITRDGRFRFVNREVVRIYGFDSREEFLSAVPSLGSSADPAQMQALAEQLELQCAVHNFVLTVEGRNGTRKYLLINAQAVQSGSLTPAVFDGTIEDVTERSVNQELLRETVHSGALARCLSAASAEFLSLVESVAAEAAELAAAHPGAGARLRMQKISEQVARAKKLTGQMSVLEESRPLSLNEIIRECSHMLQRSVGREVRVVFELPAGLWRIQATPVQLSRLLMCVAANAPGVIQGTGHLTIATENLPAGICTSLSRRLLRDVAYVRLSCQHEGPGAYSGPEKLDDGQLGREAEAMESLMHELSGALEVSRQGSRYAFYFPALLEQERQEFSAADTLGYPGWAEGASIQ